MKNAPAPRQPRLVGRIEVNTELGSFLGDTRIRLLEAIARQGSISQAAKHVPLSYKAAWDAVDAMNNLSEQPLVERVAGGRQGGGTRLTDHGRRLVSMYRAVELESQAALDRLVAQWNGESAAASAGPAETAAVPSVRSFQQLLRRMALRTSARNQLVGTVSGVREGEVDYEVLLRLDGPAPGPDAASRAGQRPTELRCVITRGSAEALGIRIGVQAVALIKSSSVLLTTDRAQRLSADNQLWGTVSRIHEGPVNSEVRLDIGNGRTMTCVVTRDAVQHLGLVEGSAAAAVCQASNVILAMLD